MNKYILICLLVILCIYPSYGQNLNELSKSKKETKLVQIARDAVLKYGPGYYREYKKPIIDEAYKEDSCIINRRFYRVDFLYDTKKENIGAEYSARVTIWADTGKAYSIFFGNGWGYYDIEDGEPLTQILYQSVQEKFAKLDDYTINRSPELTKEQADSLIRRQEQLWVEYEKAEEFFKLEHQRADSIKDIEIRRKYKVE